MTNSPIPLRPASLVQNMSSSAFEESQQLFEPASSEEPNCTRIMQDHVLDNSASHHVDGSCTDCILVCLDGSTSAETAFDWTCHNLTSSIPETNSSCNAIVLLNVVSSKELYLFWKSRSSMWMDADQSEPRSSIGRRMAHSIESEYRSKMEPSSADLKLALDQLTSVILDRFVLRAESFDKSRNCRLRVHVVLSNSPKDAICSTVASIHPRCVVMGRRGTSTIKSLLMGSTATYVLRHCSFPVVVVPV
ncbi:hypothetical protein QVD99_005748 [Batrachochytrium dendrobatidis]|nr:hypothetical protein O5D80_000771 [Batrachochytrium dendrobatidis]KAK5667632.1 hypothetical protein QVD99_005748 [Batrachochytrium dendrobatidis]